MRKIAVVTGASRGAGKGIAITLGQAEMIVYVTGRSVAGTDSPYGGTIVETAQLVKKAGGEGIPVVVDHADDTAVAALFDRVRRDHGRLDCLVNNAASLITPTQAGGFWEKPLEAVDLINVGLRSHFVASYRAAPLLIANGKGLIVNTGHYGAVCYYNGPVYGAQKAGADNRGGVHMDGRPGHGTGACVPDEPSFGSAFDGKTGVAAVQRPGNRRALWLRSTNETLGKSADRRRTWCLPRCYGYRRLPSPFLSLHHGRPAGPASLPHRMTAGEIVVSSAGAARDELYSVRDRLAYCQYSRADLGPEAYIAVRR
jgi:short chain dehydrogenase